jgi:hypothetical protein
MAQKKLSYHCPFGPSVIRAASKRELDVKVRAHNWYAHGTAPLVYCGPAVRIRRD